MSSFFPAPVAVPEHPGLFSIPVFIAVGEDTGVASSLAGDEITYCETNADGDTNSDAQDVTKFLEDFGRSAFFNPCPPCNLNR